jgi:hypothetical protein|tara:strand:- start:13136 stop:13300 length:165 start_codon:yes stop_codon:yes gene_type:complete
MSTTTVHALPSCDHHRIFEIRRALTGTNCKLVLAKRKPVSRTTTQGNPWGGDAA